MRKLAPLVVVASLAAIAVVGVPTYAAPYGTGTKHVSVRNNSFAPKSLSIEEGTKVVWTWTDGGVPHNVTPANGKPGSATSSKKGFRFSKVFKKKGTFKYVCTIHPGTMKMTVKVH